MNLPKLELTAFIKRCSSAATIDLEIAKFNLICAKTARQFSRVTTPPFLMGDNIGLNSEWQIYVEGADGNVGCFMELTSSPLNQGYLAKGIRCKFSMGVGSSRNRFILKCGQYEPLEGLINTENLKCGHRSVAEIFDLYKRAKILLENDTFRLSIDLEIEYEGEDDDKIIQIKSHQRLETLSRDLEQLLVSHINFPTSNQPKSKYSDILVKCGDSVFPCHKLILAARSKVFSAMLEADMAESVKNEIVISDMTPPTLTALLQYIYTGRVDNPKIPATGSEDLKTAKNLSTAQSTGAELCGDLPQNLNDVEPAVAAQVPNLNIATPIVENSDLNAPTVIKKNLNNLNTPTTESAPALTGGENPSETNLISVGGENVKESSNIPALLNPPYVEPTTFTWIELLDGAEKYDLAPLKILCFDKMLETLDEENILNVALAAQTYGAGIPILNTIQKFCIEKMGTLMKSSTFKQILVSNPQLFFPNHDHSPVSWIPLENRQQV